MCKDEAVLFRGNSVGTKILDYYFKLMGQNMLKLLLPLVNSILQDDKRTEVLCPHSILLSNFMFFQIAQTKLEPGDNLEENLHNLQAYLEEAAALILGPEMFVKEIFTRHVSFFFVTTKSVAT